MDIEIDHDNCIGSGQCVLSAPDVFDQDDDGFVLLLVDRPGDGHAVALREAAESCPMRAITVTEDRGLTA